MTIKMIVFLAITVIAAAVGLVLFIRCKTKKISLDTAFGGILGLYILAAISAGIFGALKGGAGGVGKGILGAVLWCLGTALIGFILLCLLPNAEAEKEAKAKAKSQEEAAKAKAKAEEDAKAAKEKQKANTGAVEE